MNRADTSLFDLEVLGLSGLVLLGCAAAFFGSFLESIREFIDTKAHRDRGASITGMRR